MLSELLRQNGYRTAGFTTNPQVGRLFGFERGFDTFVECEPDGAYPGPRWVKFKGAQRVLCQPSTHRLFQVFNANSLPPEVTTPAGQLVDQVIEWLDQPRSQPAFMWAHFMDAHWPYHVLRRSFTPRQKAQIWRDLQIVHRITGEHGYLNPGAEQVARLKALYWEALSYVDLHISRLLHFLETSGFLDHTALIVTSDHGEEFYEHGRWSHYQLFDESLQVPLILRIPGINSQQEILRQVSLLDVAPTVLDLAGAPRANAMLGHSLLRLLDPSAAPDEHVFAESMWPDAYRMAIRSEDYKYIYDNQYPDAVQLYDLQADPRERHNIYLQHTPVARRYDEIRRCQAEQAQATAGTTTETPEVDSSVAERLRALGYL